jgi:hypothetical protein
MNINQLHKITAQLKEQGAGRRGVCVSKETFTHPLESDGATILSVERAALEVFGIMDADGGTEVDSRGREKSEMALVLGGNEGCGVALHNANWIPVEDRVPTHLHSVLGYVVSGGLVTMDEKMMDCVSYDPERKVWLQCVNGDDAEVKVSHWMPLPFPPFKSTRRRW